MKERTCSICGKPFRPTAKHQIYCGKECRDAVKVAYRKERIEKQRAIEKAKPCALDSISPEDLLHYGRYQKNKYLDGLRTGGKRV